MAAAAVNFNGVKGNSGAQSADANLTADVPSHEAWFLPMGTTSRNFFLGTVLGTPIPNQIDTLGLDAALGYHFNDQWTLAGAVGPRFYRLDAIDNGGIGIGSRVATMRISSRGVGMVQSLLQLFFGEFPLARAANAQRVDQRQKLIQG